MSCGLIQQSYIHSAGSGPRVLLIQGTGCAGCAWSPQVDGLQEHFHLAWYDAPGMGQRPGSLTSVEAMADDAAAVLDALGWDRAFIAGHSLGGVIAQQLALSAPERVAGLLLMCTFAQGSAAMPTTPADIWLQMRTVIGTQAMRRRAFFTMVSDPEISPAEANIAAIEAVFQRPLHALPSAAFAQVRVLARTSLADSLGTLDCPAAVLSASQDRIAPPAQGQRLADALGCSFDTLAGGHAIPIQSAEAVSAWMRSQLESWASPNG